jgi:hypothetical protein
MNEARGSRRQFRGRGHRYRALSLSTAPIERFTHRTGVRAFDLPVRIEEMMDDGLIVLSEDDAVQLSRSGGLREGSNATDHSS